MNRTIFFLPVVGLATCCFLAGASWGTWWCAFYAFWGCVNVISIGKNYGTAKVIGRIEAFREIGK